MLIPYILTTRSQWGSCRLRVFALANKKDQLDREQRNMAALLNKFRIDYSDVTVIPDVVKAPQETTKQAFNEIIAKFRLKDDGSATGEGSASGSAANDEPERAQLGITESEEVALKDKVCCQCCASHQKEVVHNAITCLTCLSLLNHLADAPSPSSPRTPAATLARVESCRHDTAHAAQRNSLGANVHGLAGDSDPQHATVHANSRQSSQCFNLLFVKDLFLIPPERIYVRAILAEH